MADLLAAAIRVQAEVSLAIVLVLALRTPARRWLGPSAAYRLWALVPAVAFAAILPGPWVVEQARADWSGAAGAAARIAAPHALLALWAMGAVAFAAGAAWAHLRFQREVAAGRAGPAVVGVLRPRVVTPADHERRFSAEERRFVAMHEQAHIERGDIRVNLAILTGQALAWFNPLVHVAAGLARLDQEMACDQTVLDRIPALRRRYAEALLKTQLTTAAPPLGCAWPTRAGHPLEARLVTIARCGRRFDQRRHVAATLAIAAMSVGAALCVWLSQPPAVRHLPDLPAPPVTVLLDLTPAAAVRSS
jgi:beta-lactamase regulating signal transducer with metallopeptidase domain